MTLRQKSPKLFAVAESLTFAISDLFDESGQLLAALYPAPVDPDDVAVQGQVLPGSRRITSQDTGSPVTDRIQIRQMENTVNGEQRTVRAQRLLTRVSSIHDFP